MKDKEILELNQPGVVIEVDPQDATDLGAFEETALSEEDALESAKDAYPDN